MTGRVLVGLSRFSRLFAATAMLLIAFVVGFWIFAVPATESDSRPALSPDASIDARGAAAFIGSAFGGISIDALDSTALPWRLTAAALVLDEKARDPSADINQGTLRRVMKRFGFLYPAAIANLPQGMTYSSSEFPLGMTHGYIAPLGGTRVLVSNIGCSSCHAGVAFNSAGEPEPGRAVLGMPNSSLDLEAYTQAVFVGFRGQRGEQLLEAADRLFPEMTRRERLTLRLLVIRLVERRMTQLAGQDRALPFPNGSPGLTNGVAALKQQIGSPLAEGGIADDGAVSIPGLAGRAWRRSLLADGAYAPPGSKAGPTRMSDLDEKHLGQLAAITTFFTVPSMGVAPEKSKETLPDAKAIFLWMRNLRPPRFPGSIDPAAAGRGAKIYAERCASCHGSYRKKQGQPELDSFPNWIGDVGTDPLRGQLFDEQLAQRVRESPYRDLIEVRRGRGYAAPPLSGLWGTAPYLHNGSVPTLQALLDPPSRPGRFLVGGHALDFSAVGIRLTSDGRYPPGYRPYSTPALYDTKAPGRGNHGHIYGAELSLPERKALIEYLKQL